MSLSAEQRNRLLESQLRVANAEIAQLRRRLSENGAHAKRIDRAYVDGLLLAQRHLAFLDTSRQAALAGADISHCRWENALALLRLGRCHNGRRWLLHDLAEIEAALSRAKAVALENPDAYRARLPKHARPGAV